MFRLRLIAPLLVLGVFWGSCLMGEDKKPAKESIVIIRRLPPYYGRLGLSQKQKNEIYKIRGKYETEIQELYQKIEELRDQEKADFETVLTPEQLAQLRKIVLGSDRKKDALTKDEKKNIEAKGKKKDVKAKGKEKDADANDKKAPGEIKKPVEIKK